MSKTAPWLALSCDWNDSDMFGPMPAHGYTDEAGHGARLAWVCLLCWCKMMGRGGTIAWRENAFRRHFSLSERAVIEMLARAQKCAPPAVHLSEDGVLTVVNWRTYQRRTYDTPPPDVPDAPDCAQTGKFPNQAPSTTHQLTSSPSTSPQLPPTPRRGGRTQADPDPPSDFSPAMADAWRAWFVHRREIRKPVTASSAAVLAEDLRAMGEQRAMAAIRYTIGKGWQGLKEPEGSGNGRPHNGHGNPGGGTAVEKASARNQARRAHEFDDGEIPLPIGPTRSVAQRMRTPPDALLGGS